MELNEMNGFDGDGNQATIRLPVLRIVKQALLNLDYSQNALANQEAAHQLAEQFCLSEIQRTVARADGAKLWLMQVNGAIVALVNEGKLLRTKFATIIPTDIFESMVVDILEQLKCDTREVFVNRDGEANTTLIEVRNGYLNFSLAFGRPDGGVSDDLDTD